MDDVLERSIFTLHSRQSTHCSTHVFDIPNIKMKGSRWIVTYVFEVDGGMEEDIYE